MEIGGIENSNGRHVPLNLKKLQSKLDKALVGEDIESLNKWYKEIYKGDTMSEERVGPGPTDPIVHERILKMDIATRPIFPRDDVLKQVVLQYRKPIGTPDSTELKDIINILISGYNTFIHIENEILENPDIKEFLEKARNEEIESGNASCANVYCNTIKLLLNAIKSTNKRNWYHPWYPKDTSFRIGDVITWHDTYTKRIAIIDEIITEPSGDRILKLDLEGTEAYAYYKDDKWNVDGN